MNNYDKWNKEFKAQNLYVFNHDKNALLWLKVRSVCRSKQIRQFLGDNGLVLSATKLSDQNVELFERLEKMPDAISRLDCFLREKNHEWYRSMGYRRKFIERRFI